MSLLLQNVDERWQQRYQDLSDDLTIQIKAVQSTARNIEEEARNAVLRAEEIRDAVLQAAESRALEKETQAELAEQRADIEAERTTKLQQRLDSLLVNEEAALKAHCSETESLCSRIAQETDKRVMDMQDKLSRAQQKYDQDQADAIARSQHAHHIATVRCLDAEAGKWQIIESVQAQCHAQTGDLIDFATRVQLETEQRMDLAQAHADKRIEMERLRAQEANRRLFGGLPEACACGSIFVAGAAFCHKCGEHRTATRS